MQFTAKHSEWSDRSPQSIVRQLILPDNHEAYRKARRISEQIACTHNGVVEVVFTGHPFNRRRYFFVNEGKCYRMAGSVLFCVPCCSPRLPTEGFYAIRKNPPAVVQFCRVCRYELPFVFELTPNIETILEKHEPPQEEQFEYGEGFTAA